MKTIIAIKLFLVLCCQSSTDGMHIYEVKSLSDTATTGIIYSSATYYMGDTIAMKFPITSNK